MDIDQSCSLRSKIRDHRRRKMMRMGGMRSGVSVLQTCVAFGLVRSIFAGTRVAREYEHTVLIASCVDRSAAGSAFTREPPLYVLQGGSVSDPTPQSGWAMEEYLQLHTSSVHFLGLQAGAYESRWVPLTLKAALPPRCRRRHFGSAPASFAFDRAPTNLGLGKRHISSLAQAMGQAPSTHSPAPAP